VQGCPGGAPGGDLWHDRGVIVPIRTMLRLPARAVCPSDAVAGVRAAAMARGT